MFFFLYLILENLVFASALNFYRRIKVCHINYLPSYQSFQPTDLQHYQTIVGLAITIDLLAVPVPMLLSNLYLFLLF